MSNTATFNTSQNLKLSKKLSFGEEVANSVTHAVGAIAMLVLLPITAVHANNGYGMTAAVGMSVFVISLFLMFLSSAIYHAMDDNPPASMSPQKAGPVLVTIAGIMNITNPPIIR